MLKKGIRIFEGHGVWFNENQQNEICNDSFRGSYSIVYSIMSLVENGYYYWKYAMI